MVDNKRALICFEDSTLVGIMNWHQFCDRCGSKVMKSTSTGQKIATWVAATFGTGVGIGIGMVLAGSAFAQGKGNYRLAPEASATDIDNRYRAVNWTRIGASQPTGLDINLRNGLYLGAWGAGIRMNRPADFDGGVGDPGPDLYAGYRSEISKKLWLDVGVQRVGTLGGRLAPTPGLANQSQSEVYGAVTWGLFTAKYARNTNNLLGTVTPVASQYLDVSANFNLGNGYNLSPRLGRQDSATVSALAFTDYSLTLGKTFANGLSLSVTALGTNAGQSLYLLPGNDFSSRLGMAAGLKYAF